MLTTELTTFEALSVNKKLCIHIQNMQYSCAGKKITQVQQQHHIKH